MHAAVLAVFAQFTDALEGHCDCMYIDVKGLVTTGRGNLLDPFSAEVTRLPWTLGGAPATALQIATEWQTVKGRQDLAHASYADRREITTLRLSDVAIDALTNERLMANDRILAGRFPNWESVPPDAQLALHSLYWACGTQSPFPKLVAAVRVGDFYRPTREPSDGDDGDPTPLPGCAAAEIVMSGSRLNPGLSPRNAVNVRLMQSARRVVAEDLDPTELHYQDPPPTT